MYWGERPRWARWATVVFVVGIVGLLVMTIFGLFVLTTALPLHHAFRKIPRQAIAF
jgi:hypothetical protein